MDFALRPVVPADEPFLWEMLFEASHVDEEGLADPDELRTVPELARYVEGWGRPGDVGVVGVDAEGRPAGAAWVRLLTGDDAGYGYVDDVTPELAIAVVPAARAAGLGTALLSELLEQARPRFPGVCLSVRADNPARRLYERLGFRAVDDGDAVNRVGGASITMVHRFA